MPLATWILAISILLASLALCLTLTNLPQVAIETHKHQWFVQKAEIYQDPEGRILIKATEVNPTKNIWR